MRIGGAGTRWRAQVGATVAGSALLAVAAALLALSAASGPLFVSSAGAEMLGRELEGPGTPTMLDIEASGSPGPEKMRHADRAVRERIAEESLPAPVASGRHHHATVPPFDDPLLMGPIEEVGLLGVEGGLDALPEPVSEGSGDVAVTQQDAERLGVSAGDTLELSGNAESTQLTIGAVVSDIDRDEVPGLWQPFGSLMHYSIPPSVDPRQPVPPPPALLVEYETFSEIASRLMPDPDPHAGPGSSDLLTLAWRVPLPDEPMTVELADELAEPVSELHTELADPRSELASTLHFFGPQQSFGPSPPLMRTSLADAVERAEQATATLSGPVGALAMGGQVLGLLAVAAATGIAGRQRLDRARLWASRGVSPVTLGLRGALGSAPAVVVGAAAGTGLAWALVRWLGPGGAVDPRAIGAAVRVSALAAGAAVLLIGVVLAVASAAAARVAGAPRRLPPVAEVTAALLAGVAFWQLRERGGAVGISVDGAAELDMLGLALPLLLVVAVAGLGARLLRSLLGLSAGRLRRRAPSLHLASRRLGALTPATTGMVALAAAAFGAVALSATLAESSQRTIDEKAGLLVGADVVARLPRPEATREALDLDTVPGTSTVVFRAEEALLDDRAEVDVLVVDPEELAAVGYRPQGFDESSFAELLATLERGSEGGAVPALWAHPSAAAPSGQAPVTFEEHELSVDVIRRVDAFPGMAADRPLLVVGDPDALRSEDPIVDVRLASAVDPYLWLADVADEDEAQAALTRAGVDHDRVTMASELREDPGLTALDWTLGFLRGQGIALGGLGLVVLLASFITRQRQRALPTALASRMGLRRRSRALADAVELACLLAATLGLGVGSGLLAARVALGQYDPVPALALPPVLDLPAVSLVALLAAAAVGGALALASAARAVTQADIAELLRRG